MRERIAEIIYHGNKGAFITHSSLGDIADQILSLICEEIEKVENPFEGEMIAVHGGRYNGFWEAKQQILSLLRKKSSN